MAQFEIFFFNNLLTAPRTVSNTHTQVARAQSCANHVPHIERFSSVQHAVYLLVRRDCSAVNFDRAEIAFTFSFILLAEPLTDERGEVGWLVGCLTSQQHAGVSQRRICTDNFTCCHTEIEAADPTFHLTQSQYTNTGPTSPGADPITPGAWQGSHWSANV